MLIVLNVGVHMSVRVTQSRALITVNDALIALTPTLIAQNVLNKKTRIPQKASIRCHLMDVCVNSIEF